MSDYYCCRTTGSRFVSPVNWGELGKPGKSPGGAVPSHCHGAHITWGHRYNAIDGFLLRYRRPIQRYFCSLSDNDRSDSDRSEFSDEQLDAFFCDECNRRLRDQ
jgi:hypothetical protein